MSDDPIPAWAEAMEHRIVGEVATALASVRTDLRGEIANLRIEMAKGFERNHGDITVAH